MTGRCSGDNEAESIERKMCDSVMLDIKILQGQFKKMIHYTTLSLKKYQPQTESA